MSLNIQNLATQALSNYGQIGGGFMMGGGFSVAPFQMAEQMISRMSGGFAVGASWSNFNFGTHNNTLPSPMMAQIPSFNQGGQSPSNLGQFQPLLGMLQGVIQQLVGGLLQQFMGGGMMGGMMGGMQGMQGGMQGFQGGMQGFQGGFGGLQGYQNGFQQLGRNLGQVAENGIFNQGMMTPQFPGGAQAGMMNNFMNVGNLMGFAAGGFMFNAQVGFTPSQLITETKDKYSGLKNGMGDISEKTNLAQVPEARIALAEIMEGKGNKSFDAVAKELKDKYGIDAKVVDVEKDKGGKAKGIEITTADGRKGVIADGNGNNVLDSTDYKFKDAAADVMKQYGLEGLKPEDAVKAIQSMAQPQMNFGMQMLGMQMGGMQMGGMQMGGISGRANDYMNIFGNMLNPSNQNAYGTYQNNNFMGALAQQQSMPTNNFFFATSQFAMLAAQAYQYLTPNQGNVDPGNAAINTAQANIIR